MTASSTQTDTHTPVAAHTQSLQLIHATVGVVCVTKGPSLGLHTHATSSLRHHTKYTVSQVAPVVSNFPSCEKFGRFVCACMHTAYHVIALRHGVTSSHQLCLQWQVVTQMQMALVGQGTFRFLQTRLPTSPRPANGHTTSTQSAF